MNNYERAIKSLESCKAHYFTRTVGDYKEIVCYEPYIVFNPLANAFEATCYVYHWCDTYTLDGDFLVHRPYEGVYTKELDSTI